MTIIAMYACNIGDVDFNDVDLPNYGPNVVAPLGTASYTIPELIEDLEDDQIDIDTSQAGLLSFIYTDTTTFDDLSQIVVIDDVSNSDILNSPLDISSADVLALIGSDLDSVLEIDFDIPLEFSYPIDADGQLDSLNFSQGTVNITYKSTFSIPVDFDILLDDITSKVVTSDTLTLSGTVAPGESGSQSQSLIDFGVITRQNDANENEFTGSFRARINMGVGDEVSSDDTFEFTMSFNGVEFETIYGYFGVKEADIHDQSISLDFFDEIGGDISFNDPEVRITVINTFGITFGADLSGISASSPDGEILALSGDVVDELQFVNGPDINSVGEEVTSILSINSENSNIRELFETNPTTIFLNLSGQTNFSNISTIVPLEDRNFVSDSSYTINILEIEIPLDIQLRNFTKDFNFSIDGIDLWDTDTIGIRLKSINEIPIQGTFDLQFLDADSVVVHEITDVLAFSSPEVSTSGLVDTPSENITIVPLYGDGLDAFENSPIMRIEMNIETYNANDGEYVKIFYDSGIELIVGLEASLNIEL